MIHTEIVADLRPVVLAQLFIQAFPNVLQDEVIAAFNRDIKGHFLTDLQYEPGPAKMPFEFETEKSRRYYFWLVSQGKVNTANGHYVRTHKLSKGWKVGISADDELIVISAQNSAAHLPFVEGAHQVRGHAKTGWVKYQGVVDFWTDAAIESTMGVVDKLLGTKL